MNNAKLGLIDADLVKTLSGTTLNAVAYAPTLGWSNITLGSVVHSVPPVDGIQEFILSGIPPVGPYAPAAIEMFAVSAELPPESEPWIQGVRVINMYNDSLVVLRKPVKEQQPVGTDFAAIQSVGLKGDKLIIDVMYGGGCRQHTFQLNWNGKFLKSRPSQVVLELSHNANGDTCKALISQRLQFDLSAIIDNPQQYVIRLNSVMTEAIAHEPAFSPAQQE